MRLTLKRNGELNREEAKACLTANLGLPGAGSLLAGRRSGYGQVLVAFAGVGLTLGFGLAFLIWFFRNRTQLQTSDADPLGTLAMLWEHLRWPLAGIGLFAFAWLWALVTSLDIMRQSRRSE
jgi:hypothetical protein